MTSPKRVAEVAEQLQHLHAALRALMGYGEYQLVKHHLSEYCAYCDDMHTEVLLAEFAERKAKQESHISTKHKRETVEQWAPLGSHIEDK